MDFVKNPEGLLTSIFEQEYRMPPAVARSTTSTAVSILNGNNELLAVKAGQMKAIAVSKDEPAGKALKHCKMNEIVVTVDDGETDKSHEDRRREALCRISEEAYDQDSLFTEDDLARILHCSTRTIKRDVKLLESKGILIPLRGRIKAMGRGQTHKTKIIELYLRGKTYVDISKETHHSFKAIKRYIENFARVVIALEKTFEKVQVSKLVGISERLVADYAQLYEEYKKDEYKQRLNLILNPIRVEEEKLVELKKRMIL